MWQEAVKYRGYARECLKQAKHADTSERREKLVALARVWNEAAIAVDPSRAPSTPSSRHTVDISVR
jgi:hypothetical protein